MEKKYDVILNYSACAGATIAVANATHCGIEPMCCGSLTEQQIKQYLQKLARQKQMSLYSCPNHFTAHFENTESLSVYLSPRYNSPDSPREENKGRLNLYMTNNSNSKCHYRDCFNNIRNGKCTDAFIIENVGKKFFADKYKDKQK